MAFELETKSEMFYCSFRFFFAYDTPLLLSEFIRTVPSNVPQTRKPANVSFHLGETARQEQRDDSYPLLLIPSSYFLHYEIRRQVNPVIVNFRSLLKFLEHF